MDREDFNECLMINQEQRDMETRGFHEAVDLACSLEDESSKCYEGSYKWHYGKANYYDDDFSPENLEALENEKVNP